MNPNSLEYRVRRKSELTEFMGADIDDLIELEAKQSLARVAAQVIGAYVARARHSAGSLVDRRLPEPDAPKGFVTMTAPGGDVSSGYVPESLLR
jgi:hypothetical protein